MKPTRALVTALSAGVAAAAVLVTGATPPAAATRPTRADTPHVTGYILGGASAALVRHNADALTTLGVDGVTITADGRSVRRPDAATRRLVGIAHRQGLRAELLVSNYSSRLGDFDSRAAGRLLGSDQHVRRVARRLTTWVVDQGWDGVTVDLESLARSDGAGLVRLVDELQARMPATRTVSVDLMASTSTADYRRSGYHLGALGRGADLLAVMTYDQHGPSWSGPGAIGSLPWQRASLRALLREVPHSRVDLGVAGYGYTWPTRGTGRAISVRKARTLVRRDHARAVWVPRVGEWRARLADGTVVRWSDRRSFRLRASLAREYSLHGLALWRLGSADTL